jgi:hypothetical protein
MTAIQYVTSIREPIRVAVYAMSTAVNSLMSIAVNIVISIAVNSVTSIAVNH